MRPGGGVVSPDHVLPNVPDRVDPSRADRHPISPVIGKGPTAGGFGGCLTDRIRRQGAQGIPHACKGGHFCFSR